MLNLTLLIQKVFDPQLNKKAKLEKILHLILQCEQRFMRYGKLRNTRTYINTGNSQDSVILWKSVGFYGQYIQKIRLHCNQENITIIEPVITLCSKYLQLPQVIKIIFQSKSKLIQTFIITSALSFRKDQKIIISQNCWILSAIFI